MQAMHARLLFKHVHEAAWMPGIPEVGLTHIQHVLQTIEADLPHADCCCQLIISPLNLQTLTFLHYLELLLCSVQRDLMVPRREPEPFMAEILSMVLGAIYNSHVCHSGTET